MRLLNTTTLELVNFIKDVPQYVILSHTWGDGEVTFDDIDKPYAKDLAGYRKIVHCCQQAVIDGFDWAWIDTCCIDKRSSSELSEAINSMYDWYWQAEICYAYLADVPYKDLSLSEGGTCRWFSRGWTLQELLSPSVVEFYNSNWDFLGTKSSLSTILHSETTIDIKYLLDRETIKEASIAAKFSWASRRETTRPEDMAYCLLGLVGINMPMLYGEGSKAFYRLQLELLKKTNEHTLFAWESRGDGKRHLTGMLCPSPGPFSGSVEIHTEQAAWANRHEMTNKGLRIMLPCFRREGGKLLAILNCQNSSEEFVCIWLESIGNEQFRRIGGSRLEYLSKTKSKGAKHENIYVIMEDPKAEIARKATYRIRVSKPKSDHSPYQLHAVATGSGDLVDVVGNALSTIDRHALELYDDEYGGFMFENVYGRRNLLIAFGQHDGRIWIRVLQDIGRLRDGLRNVVRDFEKAQDKWKFIRDHLPGTLDDGTPVLVWAKKRRIETSFWWDLVIRVGPE